MIFKIITDMNEKIISSDRFELEYSRKNKQIHLIINKNYYVLDVLENKLDQEWKRLNDFTSPNNIINFYCNHFHGEFNKTVNSCKNYSIEYVFNKEICFLKEKIQQNFNKFEYLLKTDLEELIKPQTINKFGVSISANELITIATNKIKCQKINFILIPKFEKIPLVEYMKKFTPSNTIYVMPEENFNELRISLKKYIWSKIKNISDIEDIVFYENNMFKNIEKFLTTQLSNEYTKLISQLLLFYNLDKIFVDQIKINLVIGKKYNSQWTDNEILNTLKELNQIKDVKLLTNNTQQVIQIAIS